MLMLRRFPALCLASLLSFAALPALAESAPGRSVDELLELARNANPSLRAAQLEAVAARERVQPAGAFADPMLKIELMDINNMGSTGVRLSPAQVGSTQYTLSQQLPFWGKRDLRQAIAESGARQAERGADDVALELDTLVKRSYAQYWQVVQLEAQTREIAAIDSRLEALARSRYASGLAAQQDVIRAQVELTGIAQEQLMLEQERKGVQAMLNALMARPPKAPLAEPQTLRKLPPPAALDMDSLIARLKARNPQLAAETEKAVAADKSRELAYRNRMPDLNLGITPVQRGSSVDEWQLMFEVNLPLQFDSRRSQEREAERMLEAAKARSESLTHRLAGELGAQTAALEGLGRVEALTAATLIPQSEATFQSALSGYENGKVDFATVLDAQRALRKARQDLTRVRAEQQLRLAEIERLIGEPL
ncbi:TolC family protein [Niveibacterium sp. 24ML]|uniref:TolC family protein n=1 Tax=Niveibacterium sp. 24ML TaxID=2985512 RepID=UPI00227165CF|nr:TolC family protein [Niveibacterium sp. 24ML]MCX9158507.1 TolC family protein [Niveibacterium sp. 24ML]